jgi:hypothetical protein
VYFDVHLHRIKSMNDGMMADLAKIVNGCEKRRNVRRTTIFKLFFGS